MRACLNKIREKLVITEIDDVHVIKYNRRDALIDKLVDQFTTYNVTGLIALGDGYGRDSLSEIFTTMAEYQNIKVVTTLSEFSRDESLNMLDLKFSEGVKMILKDPLSKRKSDTLS